MLLENILQNLPPGALFEERPQWPDGYYAALGRCGIGEEHHVFCANWVRRLFAANPGRRRRDLGWADIVAFRDRLAAEGVDAWQIKQATYALVVYYEYFRGIRLMESPENNAAAPTPACPLPPMPTLPIPPPGPPALASSETATTAAPGEESPDSGGGGERNSQVDWTALEASVREALRTEHYAYATEKSYLAGIRDFVRFHNWRKPSGMGENEIVSYLAYLAIQRKVSPSTQETISKTAMISSK